MVEWNRTWNSGQPIRIVSYLETQPVIEQFENSDFRESFSLPDFFQLLDIIPPRARNRDLGGLNWIESDEIYGGTCSITLGSNDLSMTSNEDPIDILVDSIYFDVYELDD